MKKSLILLFVFWQASILGIPHWFYGADSKPVKISFKTFLLLPLSELKGPVEVENGKVVLTGKDKQKLDKVLRLHILHLYGVFTYHEKPTNFAIYNGAIKELYKVDILSMSITGDRNLKVHYHYEDEAVFYYELFDGESTQMVEFLFPNSPTTIYSKGFPKIPILDPKTKKPINTCTSLYDNSEAAFWYYWNPHQKRCPRSFLKELHRVRAKLELLPSTIETYPEYQRLYDMDSENRSELQVNIIVGQDEKFGKPKDLGRLTFQHISGNFKVLKTPDGTPLMPEKEVSREEKNRRVFTYDTDLFKATINIDYVDTEAKTWDKFANDRVAGADILIFSGHSYEGYYFDPKRIFNETMPTYPKDKYQIYFFNSCTTWSYYHSNYFKMKSTASDPKGIKNLGVLTNGIGAPFLTTKQAATEHAPTPDTILVNSLLGLDLTGKPLEKLLSWQEITALITDNAGYDYTALTNIMGDEDNPITLDPSLSVPQPLD